MADGAAREPGSIQAHDPLARLHPHQTSTGPTNHSTFEPRSRGSSGSDDVEPTIAGGMLHIRAQSRVESDQGRQGCGAASCATASLPQGVQESDIVAI